MRVSLDIEYILIICRSLSGSIENRMATELKFNILLIYNETEREF